jgi:glycine dehydrogenase subunit 1
MYLSFLGENGLREVAEVSARKAHYAYSKLVAIPGIEPIAPAPFFCEFTLRLPLPAGLAARKLEAAGIVGGLPLDRYFPERANEMLIACTEMNTLDDISRLVAALTEICAQISTPTPTPKVIRNAAAAKST